MSASKGRLVPPPPLTTHLIYSPMIMSFNLNIFILQVPSGKQPLTPGEPASCNIVIKASPDDPPLSVNLLYQLARQHGLDCSLKSHIHSSWPGQVPNELSELFNTSNTNSKVCLRFIWKSGKSGWSPPPLPRPPWHCILCFAYQRRLPLILCYC